MQLCFEVWRQLSPQELHRPSLVSSSLTAEEGLRGWNILFPLLLLQDLLKEFANSADLAWPTTSRGLWSGPRSFSGIAVGCTVPGLCWCPRRWLSSRPCVHFEGHITSIDLHVICPEVAALRAQSVEVGDVIVLLTRLRDVANFSWLWATMSSKVSLLLAFVTLRVFGRALVARMGASPTSHAGPERLGYFSRGPKWLEMASLALLTGFVKVVNGWNCFCGSPQNLLLFSDSKPLVGEDLHLLQGQFRVHLHPLGYNLIANVNNDPVTHHLVL